MRKLKYILASFVLAGGFASCETEPIDEKVKDETLEGKPILSFDLNDKQTVISDSVYVNFSGGGITVNAKLSIVNLEEASNPEKRYKPGYLSIYLSSFTIANYPAQLSIDNPSNYISSADLFVQELIPDDEGVLQKVWAYYSTDNAEENQNAGYANLSHVNDKAKYIHGNFDFILFPEEDTAFLTQRVSKGNFNYINY